MSSWVEYEGSFCVFGGQTEFNDFWAFTPSLWKTCTRIRSLNEPSPRLRHSCVDFRDSLFVFGGDAANKHFNGLSHQFRFDNMTWSKIWTEEKSTCKDHPVARQNSSLPCLAPQAAPLNMLEVGVSVGISYDTTCTCYIGN